MMNRVTMLFVAAVSTCALHAQTTAPVSLSADVKQAYNGIKGDIMKAAEKMPEAGYSFQPSKEERNFGAWVAHVADLQVGWCSQFAGAARSGNAASKTSKADLLAALKESFEVCDPLYEGTTDSNVNDPTPTFRGPRPRAAALYLNIAHDNECYGSMAVYLRMQSQLPPSTERQIANQNKQAKK